MITNKYVFGQKQIVELKTKKMKHVTFFMLGVLLALFYACSDSPQVDDIAQKKAQNYFEQNATNLAPLHFREFKYRSLSRSAAPPTPELTPEWELATTTEENGKEIVEIPVYSSTRFICGEEIYQEDKFVELRKTTGFRRLIITSGDSDTTGMYLLTLIPDRNYTGNLDKNPGDFSFAGNCKFTGKVLVSDLNGELVNAWEYKNNEKVPLTVIPGFNYAAVFWDEFPHDHTAIYVEEEALSQAQTYASSEGGGGWDPRPGGGGSGGGGGGIHVGGGDDHHSGGGGGGGNPTYDDYSQIKAFWTTPTGWGYSTPYKRQDVPEIEGLSDEDAFKYAMYWAEEVTDRLCHFNVKWYRMIEDPITGASTIVDGMSAAITAYDIYKRIISGFNLLSFDTMVEMGRVLIKIAPYVDLTEVVIIVKENDTSLSAQFFIQSLMWKFMGCVCFFAKVPILVEFCNEMSFYVGLMGTFTASRIYNTDDEKATNRSKQEQNSCTYIPLAI